MAVVVVVVVVCVLLLGMLKSHIKHTIPAYTLAIVVFFEVIASLMNIIVIQTEC